METLSNVEGGNVSLVTDLGWSSRIKSRGEGFCRGVVTLFGKVSLSYLWPILLLNHGYLIIRDIIL